MDRRTFLVSTGAVAAAGTTPAAAGPDLRAQSAQIEIRRPLTASISPLFASGYYRDLVDRFACSLAIATDGQFGFLAGSSVGDEHSGSAGRASATTLPETDIWFGFVDELADKTPTMAYFAGMPADLGLSSDMHRAWLMAAGGQMFWDHVAEEIGYKPLMIGHTAGLDGAWSRIEPLFPHDMREARAALSGLPAKAWQAMGGRIQTAREAAALPGELSARRIDFAAPGLPFAAAIAEGYGDSGAMWLRDGLKPSGSVMAVLIKFDFWSQLTIGDQELFAALAAQTDLRHAAEMHAHQVLVAPQLRASAGGRTGHFADPFVAAVRKACRDVEVDVASQNTMAQRVRDSYMGFRSEATGLPDHARRPVA